MAWNEPGGSKDKDPWGNNGGNDQGPPDLDEVVRKIQDKVAGLFGGKKGGGDGGDVTPIRGGGNNGAAGIGGVIIFALLAWLAYDVTYVIQPAERGVVLRFGQFVDTMQPGLNFRLPQPIENVTRVNVDQNRDVLIGYRTGTTSTTSTGGRSASSSLVLGESLMLTRDENIVDVQFAIQYNIKSARDYLFNVRDPDTTLREATESAVREVVGKSNMDFILKEGRSDIVDQIKTLIQSTLDSYEAGLMIISVNMQDAQPPEQVQHAFDDAVKAREDQQRVINEAEAYSNDILPRARGAAARQIEEASAYQEQVVAQADGEAQRFTRILTEYKKAPEVTRQRIYLETMESVLSSSTKVMVDVKGGNNLLFLPLDKMLQGSQGTMSGSVVGDSMQSQSNSILRSSEQFMKNERESLRGREKR